MTFGRRNFDAPTKKMVNGEEKAYTTPVKMPAWTCIQEHPVSHHFSTCDEYAGDFSGDDLKMDGLKFLGGFSSNDDFPADFYGGEEFTLDFYSSDEFRMYEFKVRRCPRGRSHDWTECPFAHPGEKARRRDPRKYHYSGVPCPDFRKGSCKRGDACEFSHGVFECWLHPTRYRTELCKDGTACRRRVCFFAHTPEQLRVVPTQSTSKTMITSQNLETYDGSPLRLAMDANLFYPKPVVLSSPTSTLLPTPLSPPSDSSPPLSPLQRSLHSNSVNEVLVSLRQLQLSKARSRPSWGTNMGGSFISPKLPCNSLPSTPTTESGWLDLWERGCEEEEPVGRVESGRDLRNKIFEKLSKENSVEISNATAPDVGWVSELVK